MDVLEMPIPSLYVWHALAQRRKGRQAADGMDQKRLAHHAKKKAYKAATKALRNG